MDDSGERQASDSSASPGSLAAGQPWWVKGRNLAPVETFLRFDLWAAAASLAGVVVANAVLLRAPGLSAVVVTLAVLVAALATARRRLADGELGQALLLLLAANWLTVVVVVATIPFLWPTMMMTAIMPAMLVLPYVEGRATLYLVGGTIMVSLGAAAIGLFVDGRAVDLAPWIEAVAVLVTLAAVGAACGLIAWSTGVVQEQELAEIVALNRELEQAQDRLAASRRRVVEAGDRERRRIERDLHDGAQQRLVALGVGLRLLRHQLGHRSDLAESTEGLMAETDAAVEELRELSRGIYPPLLRSQGLVAALRAVARRSPSKITVRSVNMADVDTAVVGAPIVDAPVADAMVVDGPAVRADATIEAALYFVAVEALTNATKHAPEAAVSVIVETTPSLWAVTVSDDGPGFVADDSGGSRGLANMADRMAALGGGLEVEATVDVGTTIRATVPTGLD